MNTEILGVVAQIVLMIVLSYPLGKYMARVYKGEKVWSDFMQPVENLIFRFSGIHPQEEMNLSYLASKIKESPNATYTINGYADSATGTPAFNQKLSLERAQVVKDLLVKKYEHLNSKDVPPTLIRAYNGLCVDRAKTLKSVSI